MRPTTRRVLGALFALAGLLVALFFGALLLIADCSAQCEARGERLVPDALVGIGVGDAVAGIMVAAGKPWRRAWPWGSATALAAFVLAALLIRFA